MTGVFLIYEGKFGYSLITMSFYTIPFLLAILLQLAIPLGVVVFCLASLSSAFKAAKNKNYAEAFGLSLPFALVVVGVAAFMAWLHT